MKEYITRKTAILVDGGYYRTRAKALWGDKSAEQRANELVAYCMFHITEPEDPRDLYRIFYYDCPPMKRKMKHPLDGEEVDFSKGSKTKWANDFFYNLSTKIKVAIRKGELAEGVASYSLTKQALEELLTRKRTVDDLNKRDFFVDVRQKGVDMRIGLDAASISSSKFVDQIILIAGDSDFQPVAKTVRRNGVDFILDPMKQRPKKSLTEHVDSVETYVDKMYASSKEQSSDNSDD